MKTITSILLAVTGLILVQCDNAENETVVKDYFPLQENAQWNYLQSYFSTEEKSIFLWSDTVQYVVKGDTVLDGTLYKKVVGPFGNLIKLVRKEGGKYYGRNHELYVGLNTEYLFLDEDAKANDSWKHYKNDGYTLTEYKIRATNSKHTFNGIDYQDVMELQVNYYYKEGEEYALNYSTLHYYAPGIGEIYTYYPYPVSFAFANKEITLLK
jgi:hypothetical protein